MHKSPLTAKHCCQTQQRISNDTTFEYMSRVTVSQLNQIDLHDRMLELARKYDEALAEQYDNMNRMLLQSMKFDHQYVSLPIEFQAAQLQSYVQVCNDSLNEIIH